MKSYLTFLIITLFISFNVFANSVSPTLEEIFITAEKKSESLQDVSQSVTALTGDDLEDRQIYSFVDLSAISPGVNVAKNEGFKTVITIRGIGNEANQNAIANPSVSYHLDGIYIASPFSLQTDFLDLERVEILRGPQGTLFGQNSTGGAINVITKDPTLDEFYGKGDITLGEYDLIKLRGSVNIPLNDKSALRASIATNRHDGFSENIALNQELDDSDSIAARLKLLYNFENDLRMFITAQIFDEDINGSAQKSILDTTPDPRELVQDDLSAYNLQSEVFSVIFEKDFPSFTLKSLSSYQQDDIRITRDNDRHQWGLAPSLLRSYFNPETNKQTTYTQEFSFISSEPLFDRVDWVAGLFYLDTEVDIVIREELDKNVNGVLDGYPEVAGYAGDIGFISDSNPKRSSFSTYVQGTLNMTETSRLIIGVRHTDDEVDSTVSNFHGAELFEPNIQNEEVTGKVAIEIDIDDSMMTYFSLTRGFKPGGSNLTFGSNVGVGETISQAAVDADLAAPSGNPIGLVLGAPVGYSPAVVNEVYEKEIVDAFEVGLKADFLDGRLRANSAAFYYDYDGLQYQATDAEVFEGGVANIPGSEILGVEFEFTAFLTDDLVIDLRLSHIETEITENHFAIDNVQSDNATNPLAAQGLTIFDMAEYPYDNFYAQAPTNPLIEGMRYAQLQNVNGNELAKTPSLTGSLALTWNKTLSGWGEMSSTLQYIYRGDFQHRIFNNPNIDEVPSYKVVDLFVGFYPDSSDYYIELIGKNITDEDGVNARFTDVFGVGATGEEFIAPKQIMVRAGLEF